MVVFYLFFLNGYLLTTVFTNYGYLFGEWVHRTHATILEVGVLKLVTFERRFH